MHDLEIFKKVVEKMLLPEYPWVNKTTIGQTKWYYATTSNLLEFTLKYHFNPSKINDEDELDLEMLNLKLLTIEKETRRLLGLLSFDYNVRLVNIFWYIN